MNGFNFFENGIKQGAIMSCSLFSPAFRETLSQSRALIASREDLVTEADYIIAISQDCDINNARVENIELILAKIANKQEVKNKTLRKGRTFKKIVIPDSDKVYVVNIDHISSVLKTDLIEQLTSINRDSITVLSNKNINIALQWLTGKLVRKPFPDGFNRVFLTMIWDAKLGFGDFLEANHDNIIELYAYVDPEDDDSDYYNVIIVALLSEACDREVAESINDTLFSLLQELNKNEKLNMLQIEDNGIRVVDNVSVIQYPDEFIKSDEFRMKALSLNFLCWPDD